MSLVPAFDSGLFRVQLAATSLGASATHAVVERSSNELLWTTVRGGAALPVVGEVAALDDYEYFANVQTFYRITSFDDSDVQQSQFTNDITPQQTAVVLKSIRYPLLNQAVDIADYSDLNRPGRTGVFEVTGRSFPVGVTDVATSVRFELVLNTETADAARRLKLLVALGDVLFLQVPPGVNPRLPPRSVYCVASSSQLERVGIGEWRRTHVPLAEVAAPAPGLVGTTLTWGTVFGAFGDWNQLISANPTWADLLATVGSPEDLVVL